jgi:ribosomal-protein-alanine N-acetyltransferase
LDTLFQFQLDKEGGYLAAFMPKDPTDKTAYMGKYTKLLIDPTVNNQTILLDNIIVGSIAKFVMKVTQKLHIGLTGNFGDKALQQKH